MKSPERRLGYVQNAAAVAMGLGARGHLHLGLLQQVAAKVVAQQLLLDPWMRGHDKRASELARGRAPPAYTYARTRAALAMRAPTPAGIVPAT